MTEEQLSKIISLLEEMKDTLDDIADALCEDAGESEDSEDESIEELDSKVNWESKE